MTAIRSRPYIPDRKVRYRRVFVHSGGDPNEAEPGVTVLPVQRFRPPAVSQSDEELASMARTEEEPLEIRQTPLPSEPSKGLTIEAYSESRIGKEWRGQDHVKLVYHLELERDARWMDE